MRNFFTIAAIELALLLLCAFGGCYFSGGGSILAFGGIEAACFYVSLMTVIPPVLLANVGVAGVFGWLGKPVSWGGMVWCFVPGAVVTFFAMVFVLHH